MFLLDTPNVWRGEALAGTPARVLALAEHTHQAGTAVTLVLGDRGADYGDASDWPVDVLLVHPADFYNPTALAAHLAHTDADLVVQCEAESLLALGSPAARELGARLVYDVHDDDAAVAASLGEPAAVVRQHQTAQRAALRLADRVIVSTRNEAAMASAAGVPNSRMAVLPNGADPRRRHSWGPAPEATTLVFVGNLFYQPNARAVTALRDLILPELRKTHPGVTLRVVGRGPQSLTRPAEGVHFTGRVDTIDEALQGATLAVAPLTAGSGAKMKVLDYLAAGLPVLGTSEAVTGLPPDHPGVVVDDDINTWPGVLADLLRDPQRLRELGQAGRLCVERHLSWHTIGSSLHHRFQSWLADSQEPTSAIPATVPEGAPRWLSEHAEQNALGQPRHTQPGRPRWLRRATDAAALGGGQK